MSQVQAGFLIVPTFEELYGQFAERLKDSCPYYAIPRLGTAARQMCKKYRGIDRDPLFGLEAGGEIDAWWKERGVNVVVEPAAQQALHDLDEQGLADNSFVFSLADVRQVYSLLLVPTRWEIIWARDCATQADRTGVGVILGYEPTWFSGDHFSALSDCMCFPQWHGTDKDGTLFSDYFARLNEHALFQSAQDAEEFLRFYLSHDWTEQGDYTMTEVCLPAT